MFIKKNIFFTCFFSLVNMVAFSELYIVKDVDGKDVSLDASDWNNYNGESGIYSILQKYQWPMNTVSKISVEERREVLGDKPDAERIFIEEKIQNAFSAKNYKTMFIPTVVYELFAILMMLSDKNNAWETISNKLFSNNELKKFLNEKKNYKFKDEKVNELLYLALMIGENFGEFPGFGEFILDNKIKEAINNKKGKKKREDIVAEIYVLYTNINNHEVTKKVHFLLNWYISNQMINTYEGKSFYKIAESIITRIDTLLFKGEEKEIKRNNIKSVAEIIKIRIKNNANTCLDLSLLLKKEIENGILKRDGVVARTIALEELANKKNQALLFRGTGTFEKLGGFEKTDPEKQTIKAKKTTHIASSLRIIQDPKKPELEEPKSIGDIVSAYKKGFFNPFSVAYGQSLFAGFFSDNTATAYNYIQNNENYGYALTIDKINYYVTNLLHINDLFFIPPLSTLVSLFSCYEFFHPRGKACIPGDPSKYNNRVDGFSLILYFSDHSGLFLIQRDPLKHEKLFSNFVADNAVILKTGNTKTLLSFEQKALKDVQEESAKFYGAIATMKQLSEKAREHLDLLKNLSYLKDLQYTAYGSVGGKIFEKEYQKTEKLLGFYNTKAFEKDASYYDLDMSADENETVRKKLCTPKTLPPDKASNSFRIMSFNVHNFHRICGPENALRKNPDYACETIKTFSPDIASLQEIVPYTANVEDAKKHTSLGPVSVNFTYLDKKMTDLGFVENVKVNDFEFGYETVFMGKAIFTKGIAKILDFNSNVLNLEHSERGYLWILFTYPKSDEKILLYSVHLSYGSPKTTKEEIDILMATVKQEMKKSKTNNVIIMGDFNNSPFEMKDEKGAIFSALKKNKFTLLNDPTPTTFTQNHAGITIDLAWVSPGFLEKFKIKNNPGENREGYKLAFPSDASDHWPIYIDFELKKKEDPLSKALSLLKAKLLQLAKSLKKK